MKLPSHDSQQDPNERPQMTDVIACLKYVSVASVQWGTTTNTICIVLIGSSRAITLPHSCPKASIIHALYFRRVIMESMELRGDDGAAGGCCIIS